MLVRMLRNWTTLTVLVEMYNGTATLENSSAVSLNMQLPYYLVTAILGICPKETTIYVHTKTCI